MVGQSSSRWRDRSLVLRTAAVGVVAALALVGCGTMMPGADSGGAALVGSGPGVSDESLKVVFVGVDLAAVAKLTGFKVADAGDPDAQVEALEDWVNAHGGVGGRQLDAVFRLYDAASDSPAAEEQLCNEITQDDQAFAVVLTGQFQTNARPCYAQRKTLVLDATLVATDTTAYDRAVAVPVERELPRVRRLRAGADRDPRAAGLLRGPRVGSAWWPPTPRSTAG